LWESEPFMGTKLDSGSVGGGGWGRGGGERAVGVGGEGA